LVELNKLIEIKMYRTLRNTSVWFDNDHKGSWQDKEIHSKLAPGMYQTH